MASIFKGGLFKIISKLFGGGGGGNWLFAILMLVSLFTKKKKKYAAEPKAQQDSPVYSWENVNTTADVDIPVPLIFGRHQVGGNIVNTYITSKMIKNITSTSLQVQLVSIDHTTYTTYWATPANLSASSLEFYVTQKALSVPFANAVVTTATGRVSIQYKKSTDTIWTMADNKSQGTQPYNSTSSIYTISDIDPNFTGYFDIRLVFTPKTVQQITSGGQTITRVDDADAALFQRFTISGATKFSTFIVGTNDLSTQTLYLDVALGIGQLNKMNYIQINDQFIADYTNPSGAISKSVRVTHEFKKGHDLLVPLNKNDFITVQSSVYNKNTELVRQIKTTLSQSPQFLDGTWVLFVENINVFLNPDGTLPAPDSFRRKIYLVNSNNDHQWFNITDIYSGLSNMGLKVVSANTPPVMEYTFLPGDGAICAYDGHLDTGDFTELEYTTQNDYCDKLDIGINAPEGVYVINSETGDFGSFTVEYEIWIAHKSATDRKADAFIHKTVQVIGSRRNRIWYNYVTDNLPFDADRRKEYNITVRKLTALDSDSNNNYKSKLVVSYVEEIKNKDIYYNNVGYCSLIMPADAKLSSGTPSFKFEVDGLSVPTTLHKSLEINPSTSNTNTIFLRNKGVVNFHDVNDGDLQLNTLAVDKYDLDNWHDILSALDVNVSALIGDRQLTKLSNATYKGCGEEVITCYFKCGDKWYKRYCIFMNTYTGINSVATFYIITENNVDSLIADFSASPAYVELLTKIKDIYTETELPSVPTDMVIYKWSANPADAILYMLTNEDNGLAIPFENIDLTSFREARDYFNEDIQDPLHPTKTIRRCELNFVIDTINNAREHINKICGTCHSALYESNGMIRIIVDRAKDSVVTLYEDDHLLPDTLKVTALPSKDMPNQVTITYLNASNNYKKEPLTIEDPKLSRSIGYDKLQKMEMDLYGVTDESHVYMEGLRLIKSARYINFTIQFRTALSGLSLDIGDVFTLVSPTNGWTIAEPKKFSVVSVKRAENLEVDIAAIEYYDEIHTILPDDLIRYNTVRHTSLPNPSQKPNAVQNLTLRENAFSNASGDIVLDVIGTFNSPDAPALLPRNYAAYLTAEALSGTNSLSLESSSDVDKFKVGDKINFNTILEVVADTEIAALCPYTITATNKTTNTLTISPSLPATMYKHSFISKYEYVMNQYEYSKYSHILVDLYKDGSLIETNRRFEGNYFTFSNVSIGTYTTVVKAVSEMGVMGDSTSASLTVVGKLTAPNPVVVASAEIFKYKHVYKIIWNPVTGQDIRNYRIVITNIGTSTIVATKDVIFPLEYVHTFVESGNYDIKLYTINTTGVSSMTPFTINKSVVVEITDVLNAHFTIQGGMIQISWEGIELGNEITRYEAYLNNEPFTLQNPLLPFDPITNPYIGLTSALKAWEGTSTQISIGNLPESGIPLSFDEDYSAIIVAKYKYNGVEKSKQSLMLTIGSLSGASPKIAWYGLVPAIVDGYIGQDNFKAYIIAIPDSSVVSVSGTLSKFTGTMTQTPITFTKNSDDLWEYDFTSLADGDYMIQATGVGTNALSNTISINFAIDTSVPDALPRPFITKDNTYVQTQLISYTAQTTTPLTGGESIDIYNSKTVQICLPPFTTCESFSHIKMYISEYNPTLKTWGSYTEYKLPQGVLSSSELVVNFKSTITFSEDMPDFKIKMVQVKKTGAEGHIAYAIASTRSKIDTTSPLIKLNAINYEDDGTNYNAVANKFINGKVNAGLGLLLDLSVTETNSGLWSNAIDVTALKMPLYYQIDGGDKKPLYNVNGRVATPYLIPKADFSGISENTKVTITVFALDNALKVGTYTFTKILDTVAPGDVTNVKTVFGVEANKGVIKASWTKPTATDFSGVRVYEGSTIIAEVTNNNISIAITDGSDKTLKFVAFDEANNEASGVTVTAKNYPPKAPVMIGATSNSGAVSVEWNQVIEDTNNDVMTDLAYYEVSYYNPRTATTLTAKTTNNIFEIKMSKEDNAYFNSHLNDYITAIKVRAVDFFGGANGTGAYSSPELQARPRFIEAVDMEGNIFKFVPTTDATPTYHGNVSSLDCIVDANYKNTDYVELSDITQGKYLRITMSPTYVAETKVKFVNTSGSTIAARFVLHYKVVHPVTLAESDIYIQSTNHNIDEVTADSTLDYAKYIETSLLSTSDDNSNTFIISLLKENLSKTNFYIKYAELLFTGYNSTLNVCELQPRTRSISNEFYGETLLLSNMISIRSTKDTSNFMEIYKDGLGITYGGSKVTTIGKLSDGSYGAWFKDKVFIGGTSIADAPIRIDSSPSISIGAFAANNSYSYISGTEGAFSSNGGLNTNCLKGNSTSATVGYNDNSKITANTSLTEVKQVGTYSWSQYTQEYLAFGAGTSYGAGLKAKFGNLGGLYGIWMTDGVYIGGTSYANAEIKLQANDSTIYIGRQSNGYYNTKITSSSIDMGYSSSFNLYELRITPGCLYSGLINSSGWYNLAVYSSAIYLGMNSSGYYETAISAGSVKLGSMNNGYYASEFTSTKIGFGFTGYSGIYHTVINSTVGFGTGLYIMYNSQPVYNTLLQASQFLTGCVDYVNGYYNTKITGGAIYLGHISGGTNYALSMYYGGSDEGARYFSIKGANLNEFFRIGKYTTTGGNAYSYYALWSKQIMLSDSYSSTISDLAANTYLYIRRGNYYRGILVMDDGADTNVPGIYVGAVNCPGIQGVSSTNFGVKGESSSSYGGYFTSTSSYGAYCYSVNNAAVKGESVNSYGGLFQSNASHGICVYGYSSTVVAAYISGTYALQVAGITTLTGGVVMNSLASGAGTALVRDNSGNVYLSNSSIRYKTLMNTITSVDVDKYMQLTPYKYMYNETKHIDVGFVAEHIEPLFPDLVLHDKEGRPESLKYDRFSVYNVLMIQQQQKEIDSLKTKLELLEKNIDRLLKK